MKKLKMKTPLNYHVGQVVCVKPYDKDFMYNERFQKIVKIEPWSGKKDLGWCIYLSNGDECHHKFIRTLDLEEAGPYSL